MAQGDEQSQPMDANVEVVQDLVREGIMGINREGQVAYVDDGFFRMLGRKRDEENLNEQDLLQRVQFSGAMSFEEVIRQAFDTGEWSGDAAGLTAENHAILLDVKVRCLLGNAGEQLGAVLIARDTTRSRAMLGQVLESQRLELIDKFTRGLGHEFKNQLTIIMAYCALLLKKAGDHDLSAEVNQILETAEQSNDLIELMGILTKNHPSRTEDCDINDTLFAVRTFLDKAAAPNVLVSVPEHVSVPAIHADPIELQKSILNLALNSIEAMPNGGTLSVDVDTIQVDDNDLDNHFLDVAQTYVVVSVIDTGVGFAEEAKRHIYEPFYTTKPSGKGLGLCVVRRALADMDAVLRVYSEPGDGTCVRVYLPVPEEAANAFRGVKKNGNREPIPGSILIIDSDDTARNLARKLLKRAGYRVTTTRTSIEGISLYKKKYAEIDLILLDVVMPNLSGKETMARLCDVRRDVPILVVSSFPPQTALELMEKEFLPCLAKPFTQDSLLWAVSRAIPET